MNHKLLLDVAIIGAGNAGMSAALIMARANLSGCIINNDHATMRQIGKTHNFITNDGLSKAEVLQKSKTDLARYDNFSYFNNEVVDINRDVHHFEVLLKNGEPINAKKLIFANGISFDFAKIGISGFKNVWAKSLFTCPYCHAYEYNNKLFSVLASSPTDFDFIRSLTRWTSNINFFTNGQTVSDQTVENFRNIVPNGKIITDVIDELVNDNGMIEHIRLEGGVEVETDVMFIADLPQKENDLIRDLGIPKTTHPQLKKDLFETDPMGRTKIPDIFIVGDARTTFSMLTGAAQEGLMAGIMIINDFIANPPK